MLLLLFDEDVHGDIVTGLRRHQPALDCVRVQDVGLAHTPDAIILDWAAQQGRVVVSMDKKTLVVDAWDRVARRVPMPGVAILRSVLTIGQAINELEIIAIAGTPEDLKDQGDLPPPLEAAAFSSH
jgi:predicted nuclease of predicted toxin-antitoxin system